MIEEIFKALKNIYFSMRKNYLSFRVIIWLKEMRFNRLLKVLLGRSKGNHLAEAPNKMLMQEARVFIQSNKGRIEKMLSVLADDKSREVWKAVMSYRVKGTPIPKSLWSDHDQYFVKEIVHLQNDEIFVDGGAFIGDTTQHFINYARKSGISKVKVIAFEPDPNNLKYLKKYFEKDNKVQIIEKGLADTSAELMFKQAGSGSELVQENTVKAKKENIIRVPVINIDAITECKNATFIKMDIEGAEINALRGGQNTILRNCPKLAICIYHSLEDMVKIVELVHELVPAYKIYIRHHAEGSEETVMYAVL